MKKPNKKLLKHFKKISSLYYITGDDRRSETFAKVRSLLKELDYKVDDYNCEALLEIPGIGASSLKEVKQFLATGKSDRLSELIEETTHESTTPL